MGKPLFRAAPIGLIAGAAVLSPAPASAFGLRTHLYIGKQVLDDVKDCKLDLPGFPTPRPIDQKICTALEKHPEAFLAGVIGPDAFPDIVIGQSYLHPGRENGRQSADWFEIILQSASSDEEISFAYGNLVHAASDIFAHSYVNNYSGGVFDILKPRDKEIEERHFLLEKYVDQRLDPALTDGLQLIVPAKFVVDTLIETNFFSDTIAMTPHEVVEALKDPSGTLGKELFERISSAKGASHAVLMQAALMVARAGRETLPCEALKAEKAMVSAHRAYLLAEAQARAMGGETIVLSFSPLPPEPSCTTASVPVDALIAELKMRLKEQVDRTGLLQDASDAIDTRNAFWSKLDRAGQTSLSQAYANYARAVRERNEKLALARFGEKWAEDVERAAEAYVEAGLETSKLMIENSKPHPPALHERASGIIHYDRWTECYLPVFFGQPFASGEATCARLEEMCGSSRCGTLDHVMPKAGYPCFSIFGMNLVPACKCNLLRTNRLTNPAFPGARLLHPYYDDILSERLLTARFRDLGPVPKVGLRSVLDAAHPFRNAVDFHLTNVVRRSGAAEWIRGEWAKMVLKPGLLIRPLKKNPATRAGLVDLLEEERQDVDESTGSKNSWMSMMLSGLLADDVVDWLFVALTAPGRPPNGPLV